MPATFDREAVRAANPIERVIPDLLGQHPKAVGGELKVRCCFHNDQRPSLRINPTKQVWRCDVCNIGGDVFDFVERYEGLTFPDALTFLANSAGIHSASSSHRRNGRSNGNGHVGGASSSTPQPAHWPPAGMLRFYDYYPGESGFIARKVRYADRPDRSKCGWVHSRDAGASWSHGMGCEDPGLYGIDEAVAMRDKTDAVIIAEGERDARRLLDLKWPAVSPPHGAWRDEPGDKWPAAYSACLKTAGFRRAYVIGDHDAAGDSFNRGIARALNAAGIDARPVPWDPSHPDQYDVTDFCDEHGADAKARLGARIKAAAPWHDPAPPQDAPQAPRGHGPEDAGRVHPILTCLADVAPEVVTWIWRHRIAVGKLNVIAGDPGLGKSFATLDLIARYTTGRSMPDGSPGVPCGTAILLSAEDDPADTIRPRLDALGADVSRVHCLPMVMDGGRERSFQLADIDALEEAILRENAGLIVIDPISAYVGDTDSHRDADVRGLLAPLAHLAGRYRVTIVGVTHLSKNAQQSAIHRVIGSIAFTGAPRMVLLVAEDPENDQRKFLMSMKHNLCPKAPTLAFSLADGHFGYEPNPVAGLDINDVLRGPSGDRAERRNAMDWLREALADGPVLVKQLRKDAVDAGIAWRTVERAKLDLHVTHTKDGFSGPMSWQLPPSLILANAIGEYGESLDFSHTRQDADVASMEQGGVSPASRSTLAPSAIGITLAELLADEDDNGIVI